MFDDEWWQQYRRWAEETADIHGEIQALIQHHITEHVGEVGLVIDLGCGKLRMGQDVFDPDLYIGIDKELGEKLWGCILGNDELQDFAEGNSTPIDPDFDEDDSEYYVLDDFESVPYDSLVNNATAWVDGNIVAVVSLFAVEMYADDPDAIYEEAFEGGVDVIISAGAYYRGTDVETANDEPGSTIRQTSPTPAPASELWDEFRIVRSVPSTMFGPDVVEVWRVMTRKDIP